MRTEETIVEVRGNEYVLVREDVDYFVYSAIDQKYIGKVLFRPHDRQGPYIAFYEENRIGEALNDLDEAVELIDRYRQYA